MIATGPPVKAKRGGHFGTAPNCFDDADHTALVCSAQDHCEHGDTRIAIEPPGSVHFAREVCVNCDRVLRWLPKTANLERQQLNAFRLAKLAMCDRLNGWERFFVRSVLQQKKVSPKQLAIIERLYRQYLEGKAPAHLHGESNREANNERN